MTASADLAILVIEFGACVPQAHRIPILEVFQLPRDPKKPADPRSGPYRGKSGEIIDPAKVDVYRGGNDLAVKPGETKVVGGLVQPSHGLSLETDPARLAGFGGAKKVAAVPDELEIVQRGKRDTHFEIVPKQPMTPERYQELVEQIELQ